jgi:hypothetical protein
MPRDTDGAGISPLVPTELLVAVLVGQLDEHVAIERGRRAAEAGNEEERRRILFSSGYINEDEGRT